LWSVLGWSREALAFHSGVSWSAIAQVEAGRRTNVRPGTLHALARALNVTIDYLVAGRGVAAPMLGHCALLYGSDSEFADAAAPFLAEAVERSEAVLAVTTETNIGLLRELLGRSARRVEFAERSSWYTTTPAALAAYREFLDDRLEAGAPWVQILGEPPRNGGSDSESRTWLRYEALLNLAFGAEPVSVMCPYDRRSMGEQILRQAEATHPYTVERSVLVESPAYADPFGLVLQS
jgi:transcriptional regulator with XRE-family HTH domain